MVHIQSKCPFFSLLIKCLITWANANNKVTDYDYMKCVYLLKLQYFNDVQSILENPAKV